MKELTDLVEELENLASAINESNIEDSTRLAMQAQEKLAHGQAKQFKTLLIEKLGFSSKHAYPISGSLTSIVENIFYLRSLGINNIKKVAKRKGVRTGKYLIGTESIWKFRPRLTGFCFECVARR